MTVEASTRPTERRATPGLVDALTELFAAEQSVAKQRRKLKELERGRDRLREALAKRLDLGFWRVGAFLVRRTRVEPSPSIDAWAAIDDGVVDEAALKPYMRERSPYDRWTLQRGDERA